MANPVSGPLSLIGTEDRREEVTKALSKYDYIRFTFVDINGIPRGVLVPGKKASKYLKSGLYCFCGMIAFGPNNEIVLPQTVKDAHYGNVHVIPDIDTLHPIPWVGNGKHLTGQFLTETYWNPSTPQEACTRNIARRLLGRLDDVGLDIYSGMELEYVLLDQQTGNPVFPGCDFMVVLIETEFESWFTEVEHNISKLGVSIETMHTEFSPGQFEFATTPQFGIKGADHSMLLKQGIKEMAHQRGWQANFMAKILPDCNGSGGHFSFSIWDKESRKNAFWDEKSPDGLSQLAKHWIAGMLCHADALTALCCMTTNCYQRLHTPWTPHQSNWGIQDRFTMLRVKNDGPSGTYFENRLPSALFNPYLVMAGTIAAGLDGVLNKLPCPEPCNFIDAPELPHSLEEAMDKLVKDEVMVEAMGQSFIDWFIQCKTEADLKAVKGLTDPVELLKMQKTVYAKLM